MPDTNNRREPAGIPQPGGIVGLKKPNPVDLAKLLDDWMHGNETEQRETFEFLRRALDEGRPEGYKLFP